MAVSYGAHQVFLARDDGYAQVARLTGARVYQARGGNRMLLGGMDVVYDVVGAPTTLHNALRWTRAKGTVVLVGVNLHRMTLDLTPVWYQEVDLLGVVGHDVVTWQGESLSTFELAMRCMGDGKLNTRGLLSHRFPLEEYRHAFAVAVDKDRYRSVKVALECG
jgi:threonine dehydrogenase-like Zn-dependent dehydrogenase